MAKDRKPPAPVQAPWRQRLWEWRWPLAVGLVLAVAAALRLHRIGEASLWLDEAYSVSWSSEGYAFIMDIARGRDFHPPEYYILLHNWMNTFGDSEPSVRALSALAGVVAVGGVYLLGRDLFSRRAGLCAAILLSVSSFALYYSQEARSYSLLLALSVLSMHAYWRHYERPSWPHLAYYVLATAALAYSHNSGLFVIAAQGIHRVGAFALGWSQERGFAALKAPLGWWALAFGGVFLLYLPWLPAFLGQFDRLTGGYWMPEPTFFMGEGVGPDFTVVGTFARFTGTAIAAWILWALVANGMARSRLGGLNREVNPDDTDRRHYPAAKVMLLVLWLLCSVFIPFIAAKMTQPAYISRAVIPALAPFLLLAGAGAGRLQPAPVQAVVVGLLVALAAPGLLQHYDEPAKEPWRDAAAYVAQHSGGDAAVVVHSGGVYLAYEYYAAERGKAHRSHGTAPDQLAAVTNHTRGHDQAWLLVSHASGDTQKLIEAVDAGYRDGGPAAAQPQCQVFVAEGAQLSNNPIFVLYWGPAIPTVPERACD